MSRPETEKALRSVRKEAAAELEQLDRQRHELEQLIEVIDQYTRAKLQQPVPGQSSTSLVDLIRERPGIRTSMIAMVVDRPWEKVADELVKLEEAGKIDRRGRGWFPVRRG